MRNAVFMSCYSERGVGVGLGVSVGVSVVKGVSLGLGVGAGVGSNLLSFTQTLRWKGLKANRRMI